MDGKFNCESGEQNITIGVEGPVRAETELAPETVREVEGLKISEHDKVAVLLTIGGLKPASKIEILHDGDTAPEVRETVSFAQKAGLKFEVKDRKFSPKRGLGSMGLTSILISGNQDVLKSLSQAEDHLAEWAESDKRILADRRNADGAVGKALGFPRTAIEAFVGKRKVLDPKELPVEFRKSEARRFCGFSLSEDNWQEEIKQGQTYADFIRRVSPIIYQEYIESEIKIEDEEGY